jgi:type I restriction enzyme M protein
MDGNNDELTFVRQGDKDANEETTILQQWLKLNSEQADLKRTIREAEVALDQLAYNKYPKLSEAEIQTLVVDDKWLATIAVSVQGELDRVSQTLTGRIRLLADRYAAPLPQIVDEVDAMAARVDAHLNAMKVKSSFGAQIAMPPGLSVRGKAAR